MKVSGKLTVMLTVLMLLVFTTMVVYAGGGAEKKAAEEQKPKILRIGIGYADLGTMDSHMASSTRDRALVDMIFNGLIRYKPGDSKVFAPDLAETIPEPEMVGGKQVWTFKLKKGVMVHGSDATPSYKLTSEDVV